MCSTTAHANQETLPALTHAEAVARLATIVAAMTALDRQIERCTDPRAESCLLTLRVEREVGYLETLYGWAYEASDASVLH
jgi:catabolite regulation protein CreA